MDFLSLSKALHSCQNILSEKRQTFLRHQEVLLSPKDKLSRVVANYPVIRGVGQDWAAGKPGQAPACWLPDILVVAAEGSGHGAGWQSVRAPADGALVRHAEAVERATTAIGCICDVIKPVRSS